MSQVVLAPVLHRDWYTHAVAKEVVAYFREAVFTPLLIELMDAGVEVDPKFQAIRFDEEGRENERAMTMYAPGLKSLGWNREDMPQIAPEMRGALVNYLSSRGVTYDVQRLLPSEIKPSQRGYYPDAVERGRQFLGKDESPVLVSRDGYLLDGHHRWTTALLYAEDTPLLCWVFDAPVRSLLRQMNNFGGVEHHNEGPTGAVRRALESGRIHYADGVFSGKFSAAISKELRAAGATFNASSETFALAADKLPPSLTAAVVDSLAASRTLHQKVLSTLAAIESNVAISPVVLGPALTAQVDRIIVDAGRQFIATVATKGIGIEAEVTPAMRAQMTEELTNNLDRYVKDFTVEMTGDLRALVEKNALGGMRTDKLAAIIESKFGVSKRKAEFLADQETGLLMAAYRESRYKELGVQEYIWSTSHDVRVRKDHRELDGKRFAFSSPPITNKSTGAHNNPGQDFRCRCVPRPIVSLIPS